MIKLRGEDDQHAAFTDRMHHYAVATVCSCNKQYVVATNIMLLQQTVCSCSGMQFPHYDVTTSWSCNIMQLQLQHHIIAELYSCNIQFQDYAFAISCIATSYNCSIMHL